MTGTSIHWLVTGEGEKLIRPIAKGLALIRSSAEPGNRCLVRRLSQAGELVALAPIEGAAPVVRLPAEDVRVEWLVTSITHKV